VEVVLQTLHKKWQEQRFAVMSLFIMLQVHNHADESL